MKAKCGKGQKAVGSTCVRALTATEVDLEPGVREKLEYAASVLQKYPQAVKEVTEAAKAVLNHRKEEP